VELLWDYCQHSKLCNGFCQLCFCIAEKLCDGGKDRIEKDKWKRQRAEEKKEQSVDEVEYVD
jgi:hypothetical protein